MGCVIIDSRSFKLLPEALEACRLYGIDVAVITPRYPYNTAKSIGALWALEKSGAILEIINCLNSGAAICNIINKCAGTENLVITGEVAVAACAIKLGAKAIDYRGKPFNPETLEIDLKWAEHQKGLRTMGIFDSDANQPSISFLDAYRVEEAIRDFANRPPLIPQTVIKHARILIDADNVDVQRILPVARTLGIPALVLHDEFTSRSKRFLLTDPRLEEDSTNGFWIQEILVRRGKNATDLKILEQCLPGDVVLTCDVPLSFACLESGCTVVDIHGTSHQPGDLPHLKNIQGLRRSRAARADLFENKMGKYHCITKFMNRLYGVMAVEHYERQPTPFYAIQAS